jgi:CBS domain-containing protein
MSIKAILQGRDEKVHALSAETSVADAIAALAAKRIGAMPVLEGGKVVGIFSERDVIHGLAGERDAFLSKPVSAVMITPVITVTPDTAVLTALSMMTQRRVRHLPVLDGDAMVGFVSIGDLVKFRIDRIEAEAAAMRDYIAS